MKSLQFKENKAFLTPAIRRAILVAAVLAAAVCAREAGAQDPREPGLPSPLCDKVQAPEGHVVVFHAYAIGVQIYRWSGSAWVFVAPAAVLYANADYDGEVATHYAGPTWESNSGSKVLAARVEGCTPDSSSIPWLLLQSVTSDGPGIFHAVSYVQRVNTVGGVAPGAPGSAMGEMREVPYTAEYYFYRKMRP